MKIKHSKVNIHNISALIENQIFATLYLGHHQNQGSMLTTAELGAEGLVCWWDDQFGMTLAKLEQC